MKPIPRRISEFSIGIFFLIVLAACGGGGGGGGGSAPAPAQTWVTVTSVEGLSGKAYLEGSAWVSSGYTAYNCAGLGCADSSRTTDYPGVDIRATNLTTGASGTTHSSYGPGTDYKHEWSATVPVQPGPNTIQISAYDPGGKGGSVNDTVIGGPANVSATGAETSITIRWDNSPGAASYNIYYSSVPQNANRHSGTKLTGVASPYTHSGPAGGTGLYFCVTSVYAQGESIESEAVHAITNTRLMGGAVQGVPLVLSNIVTTFVPPDSSSIARNLTTDGNNLYVLSDNTIWKVGISSGIKSLLATLSYMASDITTDGIWLYTAGFGQVKKTSIATGETSDVAGSAGSTGSSDGVGSAAQFSNILGITTDGTNLYLADLLNNNIRKIEISSRTVTTIAGSASDPGGFVNGAGTAARFLSPRGITTDGVNLYVADSSNKAIRKIVIASGQVTTLSTGHPVPSCLTTDGTNLYLGNGFNTPSIQRIELSTNTVTTLTSTIASSITTDGISLYIADAWNNKIMKLQ